MTVEERKEYMRNYYREYRKRNAKKISDKNNKWQKEHPEKRREMHKTWYHKKHPDARYYNKKTEV